MIPATILQTYSSEYLLPPVYAECRRVARDLHPTWKLFFFGDDPCRKFIRRHRPDLLALYDFYPRNVQRADLFRVVAVHELGGFYLDLDVYLFQPLDGLRRANLVLTEEWKMRDSTYCSRHQQKASDSRDLFQIGNYGFGARRGHWFLNEVIEEMVHRAETLDSTQCHDEDVLGSTGPDVFSEVYRRHRAELSPETILLRGRNDPPEPRGRPRGEPWWDQFGMFGNHLRSGVWRTNFANRPHKAKPGNVPSTAKS